MDRTLGNDPLGQWKRYALTSFMSERHSRTRPLQATTVSGDHRVSHRWPRQTTSPAQPAPTAPVHRSAPVAVEPDADVS